MNPPVLLDYATRNEDNKLLDYATRNEDNKLRILVSKCCLSVD